MTHFAESFFSAGQLPQGVSLVRARMSSPARLTPKQSAVLDRLVDDQITLAGRTLTREVLLHIFGGQQLPKDPQLCELLDVPCAAAPSGIARPPALSA